MIKSVNYDPSKSVSWKVPETVLSHLNSEIFLSFHSVIHLHADQTEMSKFPHDYFEEFCKGIVMLQVNLFLWSFCFQPRSICFSLQ